MRTQLKDSGGRRQRTPAAANHERWLISYADFITLLFAFFVVLYAAGQTDRQRAHQVAESVREGLSDSHAKAVLAAILGGTVPDKGHGNAQRKGPGGATPDVKPVSPPQNPLLPTLQQLSRELSQEIERGQLQVSLEPRGLVVSLRQASFFPSGEDAIAPAMSDTLGRIAEVVQRVPNGVRLEGHTDSQPIRTSRFRSNWDLSAARAIAVLNLLAVDHHISRSRLAVSGYADTAPLEANDTPEHRARNRRVDVVILNEAASRQEPGLR